MPTRSCSPDLPTYSNCAYPLSTAVRVATLLVRKEAAQGDKKTEVAPTPVTTSGVEGRKGVSWGTVKTHKVYVIDSDGDDNGSEVSPSLKTPGCV